MKMKISKIVFCLVFLFSFLFSIRVDAKTYTLKENLVGKYINDCKIVDVYFVPDYGTYTSAQHFIIFCYNERVNKLLAYGYYDYEYVADLSSKEMSELIVKFKIDKE